MHDLNFLVRQPLLDPKQQIVGYELSVQHPESDREIVTPADDFRAIASFLSEQMLDDTGAWLLPGNRIFLAGEPVYLLSDEVLSLPPENVVFSIRTADLADTETFAAVKHLRDQGFGIALCEGDAAAIAQNSALLALASCVHIDFSKGGIGGLAPVFAAFKSAGVVAVVRNVGTWEDYDACAAEGLDVFIGHLYLTARSSGETATKGLNTSQTMILQLMDMVRKNVDVRQLEDVLKRDATLSYKLLRYINSAGFGLGTEVQSLRHAVAMLGYSPLYRWLSVLLATATTGGQSAILLQTAIVRARFAELLGKGFLPKNEAENLFVVGMFSLLDRLLGVPMEEVLDNVQLSEAVTQALLSRDGMYGPFLQLTESGEFDNGSIAELAESLFMSSDQVNQAHSGALVWAQSIKLA